MSDVDQAARRAAEKCYDAHNSAVHSGFARTSVSEFASIIAAEFAPLLAEAVGLLRRWRNVAELEMDCSTCPNARDTDEFLAKHKALAAKEGE